MAVFNLADLFEIVVDTVPENDALVSGDIRYTYAELEAASNRIAHHLQAQGIVSGDHVGLQLYNGHEYFIAALAAYKLRAVPININYRYVAAELAYLYDNADLKGLFFEPELVGRVEEAVAQVAGLQVLVAAGDVDCEVGAQRATAFETALAQGHPARDFEERSGKDLCIIYTGGTTGMPRGVMWEHDQLLFAGLQGGRPGDDPLERPEDLIEFINDGMPYSMHTAAPLIHGSAQFACWIAIFTGGKNCLTPGARFIPEETCRLLGDEGVTVVNLVGDAMARPFAETYLAGEYESPMLGVVTSAGAVLSQTVREQLEEAFPCAMIMNNFGSSESGHAGMAISAAGGQAKFFMLGGRTKVLDPDTFAECSVGETGMLATGGHLPRGYYKDPEKTARTFIETPFGRYVIPGDFAVLEDDGTITLLGRGSVCINTGGEKVFPEEVEEGIKAHPSIADAIVVGIADEQWGQRVTSLVTVRPGHTVEEADLITHTRSKVAGYKTPKQFFVVQEMPRHPTGKPDYTTAQKLASEMADR
jgi:acyl-CoA synthetase (AMP-forming)/AMP-acid ligase II